MLIRDVPSCGRGDGGTMVPAGIQGPTTVHASEVGLRPSPSGGLKHSVGPVLLRNRIAGAATVATGDADIVGEIVDGWWRRVGRGASQPLVRTSNNLKTIQQKHISLSGQPLR